MGKTIAISMRQVYSAMLLPSPDRLHPAGREAGDPFVLGRSDGSGITQAAPSLRSSLIVSTAMAFASFFALSTWALPVLYTNWKCSMVETSIIAFSPFKSPGHMPSL